MSKILSSFVWALAFFIVLGLAWPSFKAGQAVRNTNEALELEFAQKQEAANNILQLHNVYTTQSETVQRLDTFLPDNEQLDHVISSIKSAAAQSGVQLRGINITKPSQKTKDRVGSLFVSVKSDSSYENMISFLSALESSLRLYDVVKLSVTQAGDVFGQLDVNFDIRAYHLGSL